MTRIAIELPDSTLSALRKDPEELARDRRLAAAAKWYELGLASQERGAEIAGLPRVEFMRALGRLGVSPFQEAMDKEEFESAPFLRGRGLAATWAGFALAR